MSRDGEDDTDDRRRSKNQQSHICGAECDDGTPCQRGVPFEWVRCYKHRDEQTVPDTDRTDREQLSGSPLSAASDD